MRLNSLEPQHRLLYSTPKLFSFSTPSRFNPQLSFDRSTAQNDNFSVFSGSQFRARSNQAKHLTESVSLETHQSLVVDRNKLN